MAFKKMDGLTQTMYIFCIYLLQGKNRKKQTKTFKYMYIFGIYKMKRKFDVKLRKVGNSYVVTIPRDTIDRFGINEGDFIALSFDSNEIKKTRRENEK